MGTSILLLGANETKRKKKLEEILQEFFIHQPKKGFNPNLVTISGAVGIDAVRNFKAQLAQKPYSGEVQVGLVEIGQISDEAQNALLKLVEEPQGHTQIIISVANSAKLLPTIVSRCQKVFVSDLQDENFEDLEKAAIDAQVAVFGDLGEKFKLAEIVAANNPEVWLEQQISFWHQVFLKKLGVTAKSREEVEKIAKASDLEKTFQLLKNLLSCKNLLKLNVNTRLLLENLFLSI